MEQPHLILLELVDDREPGLFDLDHAVDRAQRSQRVEPERLPDGQVVEYSAARRARTRASRDSRITDRRVDGS